MPLSRNPLKYFESVRKGSAAAKSPVGLSTDANEFYAMSTRPKLWSKDSAGRDKLKSRQQKDAAMRMTTSTPRHWAYDKGLTGTDWSASPSKMRRSVRKLTESTADLRTDVTPDKNTVTFNTPRSLAAQSGVKMTRSKSAE